MPKHAYHGGVFFSAIGEDFSTLERHTQIVNADVLDAWFDPSPNVLNKVREFLPYAMKTSPPTQCEGLIATIAQCRNVSAGNIIVAGGSSDVMFTFFPRIVTERRRVLILDPMYGEYAHIFRHVVGAELIGFELHKEDGFRIDTERLLGEVERYRPHMIVLVNPNSPTGRYLPGEEILAIVRSVAPDTLVVVDETYIEYVDAGLSLEREAIRLPNLVVIKSMSKVYALSGARVGYLVAHDAIIDTVAPFVPPWSVSLIGQIAGVEALKHDTYYRERYRETHALRDALSAELARIPGLTVYPSVANFLLVELTPSAASAEDVVRKLRGKNIFVRNCDSMSPRFNDRFIRVAVKDAPTNGKIVEAMRWGVSCAYELPSRVPDAVTL